MGKKIFCGNNGGIHFGKLAPEGFSAAGEADVEKALSRRGGMKLWRCSVCNDLHLGNMPLKICPTCSSVNAYVEINEKEFMAVIGI